MKITTVLISSIFALSLLVTGDTPAASGKIDKVENGGRLVTIAGTKYKVSGSRTKVMIGGKKAKRSAIKVGMECSAEGKGTAKMITCK